MSSIKLETTAIMHVPIRNYEQDFTFIINNEPFKTSRLVADLLSPKISKYHITDPTINEYKINTTSKGDFNMIINFVQFNKITLRDEDLPFIVEIIENLETTPESILFETDTLVDNDDEFNISNVIQRLQEHLKFTHFYSNQITIEIDTISENFYRTSAEDKERICTLGFKTISRIINNSKLQIESEDDVVEMINKLYNENSKFVQLYSYVLFCNVSNEKMKEFVDIIFYDDFTSEVWKSVSLRLSSEIVKTETKDESGRYKKLTPERKPVKVIHYNNQKFEGLINFLKNQSNIKDEIELSQSNNSQWWDVFENKENHCTMFFENNI